MAKYIIEHYKTEADFLQVTGPHLQEKEAYNSVFLSSLPKDRTCYYSAVLDATNTVVFALYAIQDSFLYTSYSKDVDAVQMLVSDILAADFSFQAFFAYEPSLGVIKKLMKEANRTTKCADQMWSHIIKQVQWSSRSLALKKTAILKQATSDDFSVLREYTQGFLHDASPDLVRVMGVDIDQMCCNTIESGNAYLLFVDNIPVSMTWKRRPLNEGCSVAYVYTPPKYRHQGFGGACVAMCTELFLQEFKYATLFIKGSQDPHNNMYTKIGYQLIGEVGRYTIE
ncbi:hypothetical protein INT47_000662 [Mucor saturninus]|uniref:N-acetyltransferase domain-containing protein n=1 Tax=Mucor saturninus TaxID=64648 RepID=A0A8H7RLN6_9FUNG|nr:hypothetical protein INT47_000662 [Mucor saturninus]